MDTSIILEEPKSKPKIEPQTTKIRYLNLISRDTKKSSDKLRKLFESGSYQKNTQLKVLNRYKKKLERIEKQEEDRRRKKKSRATFKLPKIKQFKGSFFDAKSADNPLKAIGLLAAFNAIDKGIQKDFAGAIAPALVAGGLFFGPSLLSLVASRFRKGKLPDANAPQATSKIPWWQKNTSSLSRSNQSYSKFISGSADVGDRARLLRRGLITPRQALSKGGPESLSTVGKSGRVAKAFAKFGGSIIPGVGAIIGAADATARGLAGDVTGSAIAGTSASLDAFAAASAATGFGLPLAGLASIASFALDLTNLARDLTGMSAAEEEKNKGKLKKQTKEQKKLVEKAKEEKQQLTFSKTLNSYDKAIKKFEEFSKNFKSPRQIISEQTEGGPPTPPTTGPGATNPYTGPIDKDSFFPLPGGTLSTAAVGIPKGEYGAQRSYEGGHSGQDIGGLPGNSPVVAWKTGTVTVEPGLEGPDHIITIDHGNGIYTKYKHVIAEVKSGDTVYGGQQIARLLPGKEEVRGRMYDTHLHFEVWKNNRHINPNPDISASQKISSPLSRQRAEEQHKSRSQPQAQPQQPSGRQISFREASPEQRKNVVDALKEKGTVEFMHEGKKYFFRVDKDGRVGVYKTKSQSGFLGMIGIPEEIDIKGDKNVSIRNAMMEKINSMYKVTDQDQSILPRSVEVTPSRPRNPEISQNLPYQDGYSDPILVPFIVPQQKLQIQEQQVASMSVANSGPSEVDLLNIFYKKVLLNSLV